MFLILHKHDENVANLDVAKTSLADVSHELAKAKHELELAKDAPIVSDVLECDECSIFKSDLASLQSKFAAVVCELEELRSRPVLLGACKLCPTLRSELNEKNALIKSDLTIVCELECDEKNAPIVSDVLECDECSI